MTDSTDLDWPGWEKFDKGGRTHYRPDRSRAIVDGLPYFEYPSTVAALKREKRLDEAAALLLKLIATIEHEAAHSPHSEHWKLAPWYYNELAIVYRKLKRYQDECDVIRRYLGHPHAVKERLDDFRSRLEKATRLLSKSVLTR